MSRVEKTLTSASDSETLEFDADVTDVATRGRKRRRRIDELLLQVKVVLTANLTGAKQRLFGFTATSFVMLV